MFFSKLKSSDLRVWFDQLDIVPGEVILEKIDQGIDQSQVLLLFVSEHSLNSSWVRYEWTSYVSRKLSDGRSVYLIPILLDDVKPPASIRQFRCIRLNRSDVNASVKEAVIATKHLVRKISAEAMGYETLALADREKIVDNEVTIVERRITLRTLTTSRIDLHFHQWQTHEGDTTIIRTSLVDNASQEIIPSLLSIEEKTPTTFHLRNVFQPERRQQILTAFFEVRCKNYHADIFHIGYSQIDCLFRYAVDDYRFALEVPSRPEYTGLIVQAMRGRKKKTVKLERTLMDKVHFFTLTDVLPMEQLIIVTTDTNWGGPRRF